MAAAHTARTVHHTGSEDSPAPGAGKVWTQRATCGTRLGAISTSTTAVPASAPGSPVRVRATHAAANPSSTLPVSAERQAAAQGSASPRRAAASMTSAPAARGTSSAMARILVRRAGPVGVTSTTIRLARLVEGEGRGRGEQREADREQHGGGGRERGSAAAHHDRHAGDAGDRLPRPARSTGPVITWSS